MGQYYKQITLEERCRIRGMQEMGLSKSEIARRLGRNRRTIQRELARNSLKSGYKPDRADTMAWVRRLRGPKCVRHSQLGNYVVSRLAMGWTPEQITGRLRLEGSDHRLSHESIYRFIYSREGRRERLSRYLPRRRAKRGPRRRKGGKAPNIPDRTPLAMRPKEAENREQAGHWEGDLIHFAAKRDILLTLQERKSRFWIMKRIPRRDAETTAQAISQALAPFPEPLRRTITHDNGGEFARHLQVTRQTGMPAFFCDPHSPWQRGAIENGNGRVRRDLPRKTNLSHYNDEDFEDMAFIYNTTPRKCLGYQSPIEAILNLKGAALEL